MTTVTTDLLALGTPWQIPVTRLVPSPADVGIDPEFSRLMPPHSRLELEGLRMRLLREGVLGQTRRLGRP